MDTCNFVELAISHVHFSLWGDGVMIVQYCHLLGPHPRNQSHGVNSGPPHQLQEDYISWPSGRYTYLAHLVYGSVEGNCALGGQNHGSQLSQHPTACANFWY